MSRIDERIKELEELISNTKYNKSTESAIGRYKAQLAKLREKKQQRGSGTSGPEGYGVRKSGDATVALLGFPSVGKSTLLNKITNAESEVGSYNFTTLDVVPGMMKYNNANIQILDVPGIVSGASSGRGRGSEVISVVRSADLILILVDVFSPAQLDQVEKEVYNTGIRLDEERPDVKITKKVKDGIRISRTVETPDLDDDTIKEILSEFGINNADIVIRSEVGPDRFIDCIEDNKKYVKSLRVLNKVDLADEPQVAEAEQKVDPDLKISAKKGKNLDELKQTIYERLDLMSIYMKEPGEDADKDEPLVIKKGSTVEDVCKKLHKNFVDNFNYCLVWADSSKFPGQKLSLDHTLEDEDILELHIR